MRKWERNSTRVREFAFLLALACEQALRSALAAERETEEGLQLRLWNLKSTSDSLVAPRRLSCQISANQNEAETSANSEQTLKNSCQG